MSNDTGRHSAAIHELLDQYLDVRDESSLQLHWCSEWGAVTDVHVEAKANDAAPQFSDFWFVKAPMCRKVTT